MQYEKGLENIRKYQKNIYEGINNSKEIYKTIENISRNINYEKSDKTLKEYV